MIATPPTRNTPVAGRSGARARGVSKIKIKPGMGGSELESTSSVMAWFQRVDPSAPPKSHLEISEKVRWTSLLVPSGDAARKRLSTKG